MVARDLVALAGLSAVVVGVWRLFSPDWAMIVGGGTVLAIAVVGTIRSRQA